MSCPVCNFGRLLALSFAILLAAAPAAAQSPDSALPAEIPPSADAAPPRGPHALAFFGVTPGVTTLEELHADWGQPVSTNELEGVRSEVYAREPFERLKVTSAEGVVRQITVKLRERLAPLDIARQMGVSDIQPVPLEDRLGLAIGRAYPERGLALRFEDQAPTPAPEAGGRRRRPRIDCLVLTIPQAEHFLARAAMNATTDAGAALNDLRQAAALDGESPQTRLLRANILANTGRPTAALEALSWPGIAERGSPEEIILASKALAETGRRAEGAAIVERILASADLPPDLRAAALQQSAELMSSGASPDFGRSVQFRQAAIALAKRLAADETAAIRRGAQATLIEAHFGIARDLAWGEWKNKGPAATKWLEKGTKLADDAVRAGDADSDWRRRSVKEWLATAAGAQGIIDPGPRVQQALQISRNRISSTTDPATRGHLEWDLGEMLYDAMQCYAARGEQAAARRYGELAAEYLERSAPRRQISSRESFLHGRLCYRLGSAAASANEPAESLLWYRKAEALLSPHAVTDQVVDAATLGDVFADLGLAFWRSGDAPTALLCANRGAELVEQALAQGLSPLELPQGTLRKLATVRHSTVSPQQEARAPNVGGALK